MKVIKLNEWTPKQFLSLTLNGKDSPIGPQKFKTTPKLSQNHMSELKETKKMKIIALYDYTTKLKLLYSLLQERQSEQDNKFENIFV